MGQVRSICLVGHSASGKTTLAASLLTKGGVKDAITLDPSQEEKDRGYSIDMGFGSYEQKGTRITLLDTPGGDEFLEEMFKAIPVADLTVLVVSAEKGVEVATERAWELIDRLKRPCVVLVNQMDRENADFTGVMASLRDHFEGKFVPLYLPIREGGAFVGVVDLLANVAVRFADKGNKEIPTEMVEPVDEQRNALLEEVSALDDALMMKFLEDEEITPAEAAVAFVGGVASGAVVPVLCGAGAEGLGLDLLMKAFVTLAPEPSGSPNAPCRAVVFNLANDPYLGRLAAARVIDGTMQEGKTFFDVASGAKVEIRDLYGFDGTKQKRVTEAGVGEIVAVGKLERIGLGTTIAAEAGAEAFEMPSFPNPVYSRTIVPHSQGDVEKMSGALKEIASTKATVRVERDSVTKELNLWGMGDIHLSVIIDRLKNRYNVTLDTLQPSIPYKETIRKQATAKYRHKKQTGGRGQFGEVELRVEPHSGEDFKFIDEIKGASIPGQYIPGVEKGVVEAMLEGNLARYPVTNVAVAVFDGSFHPVDSSELAFKLAARHAFRMAFDQASPCLLEPVMHLEVRAPEEFTGDVVSDLNGRRGRILGMEPQGRTSRIEAEVPLVELQSYALDLKSRTQGRATFQMEFLKYQQLPGNLQEKVVAQRQQESE